MRAFPFEVGLVGPIRLVEDIMQKGQDSTKFLP
jgi:hypothetical protein